MTMTPASAARAKLTRLQRIAVVVVPWIARALYGTWRVRVVNLEPWLARRARGEPTILVLWHGHMLPLLLHHRGQPVGVLISEHRDGELIAQITDRVGLRTIRGSTSRGAARAVLAMARTLVQGGEVAITPDGPRGPAYTVAPGALIVAHRTAVPMIPIGIHASRAWRLKSWDAFLIPKPFARINIAYGEPLFVDAPSARAAADQTERLRSAMEDAMARARGEVITTASSGGRSA